MTDFKSGFIIGPTGPRRKTAVATKWKRSYHVVVSKFQAIHQELEEIKEEIRKAKNELEATRKELITRDKQIEHLGVQNRDVVSQLQGAKSQVEDTNKRLIFTEERLQNDPSPNCRLLCSMRGGKASERRKEFSRCGREISKLKKGASVHEENASSQGKGDSRHGKLLEKTKAQYQFAKNKLQGLETQLRAKEIQCHSTESQLEAAGSQLKIAEVQDQRDEKRLPVLDGELEAGMVTILRSISSLAKTVKRSFSPAPTPRTLKKDVYTDDLSTTVDPKIWGSKEFQRFVIEAALWENLMFSVFSGPFHVGRQKGYTGFG
ncbi:MAG: hypothetical protein M1814_002751 [Vezdaea aestivalis]|nr:MAG: hypothetical protein M1814_002751 [Vezdaea aestivalis]